MISKGPFALFISDFGSMITFMLICLDDILVLEKYLCKWLLSLGIWHYLGAGAVEICTLFANKKFLVACIVGILEY